MLERRIAPLQAARRYRSFKLPRWRKIFSLRLIGRWLRSPNIGLAAELGPKGIRVHAISPGPLATRAASGIQEFDALPDKAKEKAPARSLVSIDDVGVATAQTARVRQGKSAIHRFNNLSTEMGRYRSSRYPRM